MHLVASILRDEEVITMTDRLDENERAVKHQRNHTRKDELRRAECGSGRTGGDIRQDEGQDGERCEHGQCSACSLELEALLVVANATRKEAQTDDAIAYDHHHCKHGVSHKARFVSCDS